jgi:hypothetical protein
VIEFPDEIVFCIFIFKLFSPMLVKFPDETFSDEIDEAQFIS